MPSSRRFDITRRGNAYDSPILDIYVRDKRQPYQVHLAPLKAKTTFLDKVEPGDPPAKRPRLEKAGVRADSQVPGSGDDLKSETESTIIGDNDNDIEIIPKSCIVYNLSHTKIKEDVFNILVNYLYNTFPGPLHNFNDAKTAIRAYVLAVEYDVVYLQNELVDRMRDYHATTNFNLDLLVLMVNRLKDVNCEMAQYLVAQMAHDISKAGYEAFEKENSFMKTFVEEGSRAVRIEVFKAVVGIAKMGSNGKNMKDPADRKGAHKCKWHVHKDGVKCPVVE